MVSRDRGQLILIGAIAIALILLGLVLIVNTALFTQVVGSEGTVESAKEGGVSGQEIGSGIAAIVAEENREEDYVSNIDSDADPIVRDDLQPEFVNRTIEGSGSFVSMAYESHVEEGRVIEQESAAAFGDDDLVTGGDIGHFVLNVDTAASADEEFDIVVDPATGSPRVMTVDVDNGGSEADLSLGGSSCKEIRSTSGTIRIDLVHGSVYGDSNCQFRLFDSGEETYHVEFDGGDDVIGTYITVTNDTSVPSPPSGSATISEAVWSFAYEFTYDSTDATVVSERREVDVYD